MAPIKKQATESCVHFLGYSSTSEQYLLDKNDFLARLHPRPGADPVKIL